MCQTGKQAGDYVGLTKKKNGLLRLCSQEWSGCLGQTPPLIPYGIH